VDANDFGVSHRTALLVRNPSARAADKPCRCGFAQPCAPLVEMKIRSIGLEKVSSPPKCSAAIKGAKVLCSMAASNGVLVSIDKFHTGFPKLNPLIRLMVTVMFSGSIAN